MYYPCIVFNWGLLKGLILVGKEKFSGGGGVSHLYWYYWRILQFNQIYHQMIALGELIFYIINSISPKSDPFPSCVRACVKCVRLQNLHSTPTNSSQSGNPPSKIPLPCKTNRLVLYIVSYKTYQQVNLWKNCLKSIFFTNPLFPLRFILVTFC